MGMKSRRKGRRWENAVVDKYKKALPGLADRIVRRDQSRSGTDGADVDVAGLIWNECKVGARPNPLEAWKQCTTRSYGSGCLRTVIVKKDNEEPVAIVSLEAWLNLLSIIRSLTTVESFGLLMRSLERQSDEVSAQMGQDLAPGQGADTTCASTSSVGE